MKDFINALEDIFWDLWNELYKYLCSIFETEPNPDWFAPLPED